MAEPVAFGSDLQAKKILKQFYMEYIDGNELAPFMGDEFSVIHVKDDIGKGEGDNIIFSLLEALDPDALVTGMTPAKGNEQSQVVRSDAVRIHQIRASDKLEGVRIIAQRTPIQLFEALRPQLLDVTQQRLRNDIIDAAAYALGGSSPVQNRSIFGAVESNYNATLATALGNIDSSADKLTVALIRAAKRKAVRGGHATASTLDRKIRPFKLETDNGMKSEYFALFVDTRALADLQNDTTWIALATQGKFELNAPSLVRGSRFAGMVDNVLVYELPQLDRIGYATAGSGPSPVAHNLFCGAQAFGLGVAMQSEFDEDTDDYGNFYGLCHTEMRGHKMLKFNNGTADIENGLIHLFTTAANG